MNRWREMSYNIYPQMTQHERLSWEFEKDIDVDDFDIEMYLNDDNEEE